MIKERTTSRWFGLLLLSGLLVATTGCDDLFDVTNPGRILDEDLNDPQLVETLVVGMSADFSDVIDGTGFDIARLTDEMAGSGSYLSTGRYRRGLVDPDDVNSIWEQAHEARWVVEDGLERMEEMEGYDPEGKPETARGLLFAGLSNRILGEIYCEVTYDSGARQDKSAAFQRAVGDLEDAIQHGDASGDEDGAAYATAARGGLAQAYVGLGDWDSAVQYASQVDTDFEYVAHYHESSNTNQFYNETHSRYEISALATLAGSFDEPGDPRAPFTKCGEYDENGEVVQVNDDCDTGNGADGETPHWRQEKFPERGSDIPVVKGTEMRLIEAEAALLKGELGNFTSKINDVRSHYGLEDIPQPARAGELEYPNKYDDAWSILDAERHLTLWLEGRRMWDLHRWDHPFLNGGVVVHGGVAERRASCMPIPFNECQTNPNVTCPT